AGTAFSRCRKQREIGLGVGDRSECRGPAAIPNDPDRLADDAVEGQDMPHPERSVSCVPYAMTMEEGCAVTLADDRRRCDEATAGGRREGVAVPGGMIVVGRKRRQHVA